METTDPTADDRRDEQQQQPTDAQMWNDLGEHMTWHMLEGARCDADESAYAIIQGLCGGIGERPDEVTAAEIAEFRQAHSWLQVLVEDHIVPVVDGVEPWENALGHVPYRVRVAGASPRSLREELARQHDADEVEVVVRGD